MKRTRRTFSREEKLAAIRRVDHGEPSDLDPNLVRRWRDEWHRCGDDAFTGCGNRRVQKPKKTEPIVFRMTYAENERLLATVRSSSARTLSEFARRQLFEPQPEPQEIERKIDALIDTINRLSRRLS